MLRLPLVLATLGLAWNVMLWSVPGFVVASGVPHLAFPSQAPQLHEVLAAAERDTGDHPSLHDALLQLIGAEAEAMQVASLGLQQPTPPDLAERANHAGTRVLGAVQAYLGAAGSVLHQAPGR